MCLWSLNDLLQTTIRLNAVIESFECFFVKIVADSGECPLFSHFPGRVQNDTVNRHFSVYPKSGALSRDYPTPFVVTKIPTAHLPVSTQNISYTSILIMCSVEGPMIQ